MLKSWASYIQKFKLASRFRLTNTKTASRRPSSAEPWPPMSFVCLQLRSYGNDPSETSLRKVRTSKFVVVVVGRRRISAKIYVADYNCFILTVCAPSWCWRARQWGNIDPLLAAGADIVSKGLYCRRIVVGWPMVEYKAAFLITTVDYFNIIFRCTIISKCTLNLVYN